MRPEKDDRAGPARVKEIASLVQKIEEGQAKLDELNREERSIRNRISCQANDLSDLRKALSVELSGVSQFAGLAQDIARR